jgi:hypothetical protein
MTLSTATAPSANADRVTTETPAADAGHHLKVFAHGDDSPSFKDLIDIINPLQHIPIINTIYRELTGDEPGAVSRVAGGALYGGVIGLALASADTAFADTTGKDVGETIWAYLNGDEDGASGSGTQVAKDDKAPQGSAAPQTATATASPSAQTATAQTPAAPGTEPPAPVSAGPQPLIAKQDLAPLAPTDAKTQAQAQSDPNQIKIAAAIPPPVGAKAPSTDAGQKPLPTGFMPVPQRRAAGIAPSPIIYAPVTPSSQNSNVPVTGMPKIQAALARDAGLPPVSAATPPASPQTTLTAQQIALQNQPLPQQQPAESKAAPPNQWLPSAMAKALDKYEQMQKLNKVNTASTAAPMASPPTKDVVVPPPASAISDAPLTAMP